MHDLVEPDRIRYKDWRAYFNILLDNNKKPLCRLRFNDSDHKQIGLFDKDGSYATEEKVRIDSLNDLYQYADRIQATAKLHVESR